MNTYNRFGVMLDMSRNAVMKPEEVMRFMDVLKKMGYNTVGLYLEDVYQIDGEPYFGYLRGRYTAQEIKEIDGYAKSIDMQVIPYIQTLAHLNGLVRHSAYQDVFDLEDVLLIDEPKTYRLIEKMLAFCAENFSSKIINIGMDEAFNVGLGNYLKKHGYKDKYEILLRHLNKVVDIAKKHGLTPNMWSDMFFRIACGGYEPAVDIPDSVKELVPDVGLEYWDYYHKDKAFYDGMFKSHFKFNKRVCFAGGAWCWHGFAPLSTYSLQTMKPAMQSVREHGVKDVIITMWGDGGHECSFYSLLPVLYAIRQFADGNYDMDKIEKGFEQLIGLNYKDFMLLETPNLFDFSEVLDQPHNPCRVLLYSDIFMGYLDKNLQNHQKSIPYGVYAEKLNDAKNRAGDYAYVFDFMAKLCSALELKAEMGIKLRKAYKNNDKIQLKKLTSDIDLIKERVYAFHKAFSILWHKENKPYGFEIHDARLGGLIMRLTTCKERLIDYLEGKVQNIPELEEEILTCDDGKLLRHHDYTQIISNSRM